MQLYDNVTVYFLSIFCFFGNIGRSFIVALLLIIIKVSAVDNEAVPSGGWRKDPHKNENV